MDVNATAVNFVFDDIELSGIEGTGFLQSRTLTPGESGTQAQGLYGYEYRIDLTEVGGILNMVSISSFRIVFGPVESLDFDGDGTDEKVYFVTSGGLGNIAPTSVDVAGDTFTFNFSPGICVGNYPGGGDCSFFFGLVSAYPAVHVNSEIHAGGTDYILDARAPDFPWNFAYRTYISKFIYYGAYSQAWDCRERRQGILLSVLISLEAYVSEEEYFLSFHSRRQTWSVLLKKAWDVDAPFPAISGVR